MEAAVCRSTTARARIPVDVRQVNRSIRSSGFAARKWTQRSTNNLVTRAGDDVVLDEAAKLLEEADRLMSKMGGKFERNSDGSPDTQSPVLQCDVSGCTVVRIRDDEDVLRGPAGSVVANVDMFNTLDEEGSEEDFALFEGAGWKLGYDRSGRDGEEWCACIGGDNWTAMLTLGEYQDFIKTMRQLQRGVANLEVAGEWVDEAALEYSTSRVWCQGRAPASRLSELQSLWTTGGPSPAGAFSLRFVFTSSRREVSASWTPEVVLQVLEELSVPGGPGEGIVESVMPASPATATAPADPVSVTN